MDKKRCTNISRQERWANVTKRSGPVSRKHNKRKRTPQQHNSEMHRGKSDPAAAIRQALALTLLRNPLHYSTKQSHSFYLLFGKILKVI